MWNDNDRFQLEVLPDSAAVAWRAAELFTSVCHEAGKQVTVALSGGSTPRALHSLLAASPWRDQISWQRLQFFWGDERWVPAVHADSNFHMAEETLLSRVPVTASQIHRVLTESESPDAAAEAYETEIRRSFDIAGSMIPRFDLIVLGMGPDGHTASLFPRTAALHEATRLVVANAVPQLETTRITCTVPLINHAKRVMFLVTGQDKAHALAEVLQGDRDPEQYPSQLVQPVSGEVRWVVDNAAASLLRH